MTTVDYPLQHTSFSCIEPTVDDTEELCRRLGVTTKYGYSFAVYFLSNVITISKNGEPVLQVPTCGTTETEYPRNNIVSVSDAVRWFNTKFPEYKAHDMTWIRTE